MLPMFIGLWLLRLARVGYNQFNPRRSFSAHSSSTQTGKDKNDCPTPNPNPASNVTSPVPCVRTSLSHKVESLHGEEEEEEEEEEEDEDQQPQQGVDRELGQAHNGGAAMYYPPGAAVALAPPHANPNQLQHHQHQLQQHQHMLSNGALNNYNNSYGGSNNNNNDNNYYNPYNSGTVNMHGNHGGINGINGAGYNEPMAHTNSRGVYPIEAPHHGGHRLR